MAKASIEISAIDKTKAAFDSARKNLAGLGEQVAALPARFGTLGIAIATAFSAVSVKSVIDGADQLNKLSQKTGIAVESLSELKYAGSLADVSIESIALGVKKLSSNMFEAASGGKEAAETFDLLGVAFKNGDGSLRNSDKVLADIAERFAGLADGPEKSALAVKTFGKAGADLIPLLNAGKHGLEAMRIEAKQLGVVISTETAKAAEEFNDNLTRMGAIASASSKDIAGALLPTMVDLTDAFVQARKEGGGFTLIADGVATAFEAVVVLGANIAYVFKSIGDTIGGIAAQAAAIARLDFKGVGVINDAIKENNLANRRKVDDFSNRVLSGRETKRLQNEFGNDAFGDGKIGKPAQVKTLGITPKPTGGTDNSAARELEKQAKLLQELSGLTGSFAEDWQRLSDIFKKGGISLAQLTEAQSVLLSKQPAIKAQAEAEQKLLEIREKNDAVMRSHIDTMAANNAELIKSNRSLLDEVEEIGLNAEALNMLRMARVDANIVREEENLLQAQSIEGNELEVAQMERNIALLKEQRLIKKDGIYKQQRADEIDQAKRRTDTISESISQGVMTGFRNGGSFADVFLNELKAQFAKTVLTPLIRPQVEAGNEMISGLFKGMGGGGGFGSIFSGLFGGGGGGFMNDAGGMELAGSLGFDGGGYTGDGLRTGGLDGKGGFMAMMHPQETVIDHTKGRGGSNITLSNNITVGGGMASGEVYKTVQQALAENNRQWTELLKRQGVLA